MNILHLTHTDVRSDNRILKQVGALSLDKQYNIRCLGVSANEGAKQSNLMPEAEIITLSLLMTMPKWVPRVIRHALMLMELYLRFSILGIRHKPRIIHCHDTMVLPIGVFIKLTCKSKLIYDAHELESNKNGQTKFLSIATLLIEKVCWTYVDHLISVSDSILEWYNNNLGEKKNSLILNSPLLSDLKVHNDRYFHKLYGIDDTKLVFIYLGILGNGRGIDLILDAFSGRDIVSHVVFVGFGELEKKIKEKASRHHNIHIHNAVPHEEVVSLVMSADVGLCLIEDVSLSDYYCLPNKLFEYIFAGVPILSSDFPDISRLVHAYNLGKVCTVNISSIVRTIHEMESCPLGRLEIDLSDLSWQKQAERLRNAYKLIERY